MLGTEAPPRGQRHPTPSGVCLVTDRTAHTLGRARLPTNVCKHELRPRHKPCAVRDPSSQDPHSHPSPASLSPTLRKASKEQLSKWRARSPPGVSI